MNPKHSEQESSHIRHVKQRWLHDAKPYAPDPPSELVKAAQSGKLVPLIGAGISRQAIGKDGVTKLPSWPDLIENLANEAERLDKLTPGERKQIDLMLARGKYLMVADSLRKRLGAGDYERFLSQCFEIDLVPAEIHTALCGFKVPLILTTNYDYLLEDTFSSKKERRYARSRARTQEQANKVQDDIQNWTEDKPPVIFKIHGSIDQPHTIVLTEQDYRNLIFREPGYRTILTAILVTHTVLMLGFSFDDPELTQLFGFMRDAFEYKSRSHYILMPSDKALDLEKEYNLSNFGVRTITYHKSSDDHPEVLLFVNKLINSAYRRMPVNNKRNRPKINLISRRS